MTPLLPQVQKYIPSNPTFLDFDHFLFLAALEPFTFHSIIDFYVHYAFGFFQRQCRQMPVIIFVHEVTFLWSIYGDYNMLFILIFFIICFSKLTSKPCFWTHASVQINWTATNLPSTRVHNKKALFKKLKAFKVHLFLFFCNLMKIYLNLWCGW